jgi:hypothetical protein
VANASAEEMMPSKKVRKNVREVFFKRIQNAKYHHLPTKSPIKKPERMACVVSSFQLPDGIE